MWLFITARLRQWAIFAIVVPVLTVLVRAVRIALEKKSGESTLTRSLRKVEEFGGSKKKRSRRR